MPIYVYECQSCEKVFEVEQRIIEDPLTECECGGFVKRVIQPVGVSFKGSGFYVNDSAGSKPSDSPKVESPSTEATPAPAVDTPAPSPTKES